eukprot:184123_1
MVSTLILILLLYLASCHAQHTTTESSGPNVRLWNFKIKAETTIEYIMHSTNQSFTSKDIARCGKVVINAQTDLTLDSDYTIYVDVARFDADVHNETNQIIANFTVWTNNRALFDKFNQFLDSDEFEEDLTKEMEDTHDDLDVVSINSKIVDTHGGQEPPIWETWLDMEHYTPFQWACVSVALLLICITMFCLVYCCVRKVTDDSDPYKNVRIVSHDIGQVSPRSPNAESPQDMSNQDVNWVQC